MACHSGYYSGNFSVLYEINRTILKFLNQRYPGNTRDVSQFCLCLYSKNHGVQVVIILHSFSRGCSLILNREDSRASVDVVR